MKRLLSICFLGCILNLLFATNMASKAQDVKFVIHVRGVAETKVSLIPLSGTNALKPMLEKSGLKSGESAFFLISPDRLPGEFVLRLDFKEKSASTSQPSEMLVIISDQDLELWVHPMFGNHPDSTYFQKDEKENSTYKLFSTELSKRKDKMGVLQNFLMNYDDTESTLYKEALVEYESRRAAYNTWIVEQMEAYKHTFISRTFIFDYMQKVDFQGNESDRIVSLINNYFEGMNFQDTMLLKSQGLNEWMNNYVNLYGSMVKTAALRDSLFSAAGLNAIEKARKGHPLMYGWMVDYFYRGYEANGIDAGMKILEPYINDEKCLTEKRVEINRRLKAIASLVAGTLAPDIKMKDINGNIFELSSLKTNTPYILLLFWSAGCNHCVENVDLLYPWSQLEEIKSKVMVVAISLDDNDEDIAKFNNKVKTLSGWTHLHTNMGVNSVVANDYGILSTPVMFLLNAKDKVIKSAPQSVDEVKGL